MVPLFCSSFVFLHIIILCNPSYILPSEISMYLRNFHNPPTQMTRRSLIFFGNAFRSAKHITFAHGPVQNRIRPILHQKCNLQNYASRSSQKHIFAKLLQTKIKTYTCKRKSKFLLHFWALEILIFAHDLCNFTFLDPLRKSEIVCYTSSFLCRHALHPFS